jgi:putative heme-binding domain-containing protein
MGPNPQKFAGTDGMIAVAAQQGSLGAQTRLTSFLISSRNSMEIDVMVRRTVGILLTLVGVTLIGWQTALTAETRDFSTTHWIWGPKVTDTGKAYLRKKIQLPAVAKLAHIVATADNGFSLSINGKQVLQSDNWQRPQAADITKLLQAGDNLITIVASNDGGPAALLVRLEAEDSTGTRQVWTSDESWKASNEEIAGWDQPTFDDTTWPQAQVLSVLGSKSVPWTGDVHIDSIASLLSLTDKVPSHTFSPEPAADVTAPAGFRVEKLIDVPKSLGSWVSLANAPNGKLIASDQGGAGLFLISPAKLGTANAKTTVERLPVNLSSAQGLLWHNDALYVMVNGPGSGLHRATDTNGDGLVDTAEHLMPLEGGGEHGPHALVASPDGKAIYAGSGNHTKLPKEIAGSRSPSNWAEDLLLPRRWDARGHAAGILAPGGWICDVDPSGKNWTVHSMGYRNQYDFAFNADGELFAYDADMEWDFGSPWYRPTRVCHATSGSEFGWRSGTGKWPTDYEDSLPPVVDIGPGSPVGVLFGYGAKFPAKYQRALYLLDWTYSTIHAITLTPNGASYTGTAEDFVFGQPLQVTDAVIGADGAMYFLTGGRGTQSALFRVVYEGSESTAPVEYGDARHADLRALRHKLESFHRPGDADFELIWKNLGHEDRFIRYAARVALEHRPIDTWRDKALAEQQPATALMALMALARQGTPDVLPNLLTALEKLDIKNLTDQQALTLLRTYQLAFARQGKPSDEWRKRVLDRLDPLFPSENERQNAELLQLLVYLESPTIVSRGVVHMLKLAGQTEPIPNWSELAKRNAGYGGTVQAMLDNMPPVQAIHYAFALRNAKTGWDLDLRRKYYQFFQQAAAHPGGASFPGFLEQMRGDALANVSPAELVLLDDILSVPLGGKPFESTPPVGPGQKWTKSEALAAVGEKLRGRNFDKGHNLFHATSCSKCHRFAGFGGAVGPDLSTAGRKFALPDMLDALIEPSKAISDQYGSHQVITSDGQTHIGRVVELDGKVYIYTIDANAAPKVYDKADIEEMVVSPISQMPEGLINTLNAEELKDLLAYIYSAGNRNADVFKP